MATSIKLPVVPDFNSVAQRVVSRIDIESAWGPKISVDDPFEPGPPDRRLQALQPRVTLHMRHGGDPVVIAPYGDPPPTKWPLVRDSLTAGALVVGAGALYWLINKL
jgi:hypothetical protein